MLLSDGSIPMRWWDNTRNFGDLLGPWLVERMTGKGVTWVPKHEPHYVTVGSILGRVSSASVVWGTGSFGSEHAGNISHGNRYLAVRGPLTRARLEMFKQHCPDVYGDPALLVPEYHPPVAEQKYELGLILRWSETKRKDLFDVDGVKMIDLETGDIEDTLDAITSCNQIISTSLHGLILADAYGIPNAWLIADTGFGKEHKFWDYLLSVRKEREPVSFDITQPGLTKDFLMNRFSFDDRTIRFDADSYKESCPFVSSGKNISTAEAVAYDGAQMMRLNGKTDTKSVLPRYELNRPS